MPVGGGGFVIHELEKDKNVSENSKIRNPIFPKVRKYVIIIHRSLKLSGWGNFIHNFMTFQVFYDAYKPCLSSIDYEDHHINDICSSNDRPDEGRMARTIYQSHLHLGSNILKSQTQTLIVLQGLYGW